jgi:uncharacterized protein (TIGR02466 family)|tara:strand:+ start:971 stop:1648 length:678 start_codon:yes stop_codon:yes gene_type:complete
MPEESSKVNFHAIRPFGPTILTGQIPKDLIKILDDKATDLMQVDALAKEWDHSMHLAGNVKQEVRYPPDFLRSKEFAPVLNALQIIVQQYISIPPACDTISVNEVGAMSVSSMWVVSQYAGDFNPMHVHDGELSGVLYLRIPKDLKKEYEKEDHFPCVGDIHFMCGQAAKFNGHNFQATPKVGDIFLFPSWLSHEVYPFRTPNQERRSVSFNVDLKRKDKNLSIT